MKPSIVQAPNPVALYDGDTAKFVARIQGYPQPQVTWFLNGQQLSTGSRVTTQYDGFAYTLEVMHCSSSDSGRVELSAHNQYGLDRAQTQLTVTSRQPEWQSDLKTGQQHQQHQPQQPGTIVFPPPVQGMK